MKRFFWILFLIAWTVYGTNVADAAKSAPLKKTAAAEKEKNEADFKKAEAGLYSLNTKTALPELTRLCDKNYLRACSLLGFTYYSGRYGVAQDTRTGIEWYKKCAEKEKNFFCHNELGRIYYRMGDYENALSYYKPAAAAEDSESQYRLARLYMEGKGVHTNYEKALKWMRKAAHARKNPSNAARCALVEMSYFGIGMRRSIKDTKYWLTLCDTPFVQALMFLYGHGVPKDKEKAKEILIRTDLKEALSDWNDFTGQSMPSVGRKNIRDQQIPEDCRKGSVPSASGITNVNPATYVVKIFASDFYRNFDVYDGYIEKAGIGDQTFEACGVTFYTTPENKRLFLKSLKNKNVIKISRYKNACLGSEIVDVCDLNLPWREPETEEEQ